MIQINDNDLPITAAEKIINGVKPNNPTFYTRLLAKAVTGDEHAGETVDMFDLEEIKEIADYLTVFYEAHKTEIKAESEVNRNDNRTRNDEIKTWR